MVKSVQEPGPEDIAAIIRSCDLFSSASRETLERVASASTYHTAKRGTTLFFTGDEPDGLRILIKGLIRIWINDDQGRELTLALYESGDAFGEMALLDGRKRSANATVMDAAEFLLIGKAAFEELLQVDIQLALHLIQTLCRLLRNANETQYGTAYHDLGSRLADLLIRLSQSHAQITSGRAVFRRKFSQTEMAHMLGATREAVNKRLAALVGAELVLVDHGIVTIPDLEALAHWSAAQHRS